MKAGVAGRSAEKEYVLLGGFDERTHGLRKEFPEPRTAGEYVAVSLELGVIGQRQTAERRFF